MVLGMLPVSAMAAGSVVTARGSAENPIRIYENSGNQAETSNGSVQVPVGETVTDSGVLTFSTYSAIEGVQVSKGGVYCAVTSSNENVVKATGSWSGGVLTINFQGVGNGTAKITVDYTCTCSKGAAANGYLIYNVTVGDGGTTDPSGKPNAPTASDIGAFPDAGKAVLLHCVDAGARGHDATASSLNRVQNGYSVGEVVENPGTYYNVDGGKITKEQFPWMCVVTVHAAPFIELYNSNFSESYGVHKLAGTSNATATLHWFWHNTYGWQYLENPPIQFNITRDTSEKTYTLNYYKNTTDTVTNMPVPNPQTEKSNTGMVTFTVSSAIPAREGYNFLGWNGDPNATEHTVSPGNTVTTPRETTNLYAVWESKTPPPEIPGDQKPNIEEANAKIRVQCIEYPSKHNPYKQNYRILPGSYEDLGWDQTEYGYIYSIRLNRAKYIAQFDQEIGRPHTDTEPNEETRINWRWENGAWHLIGGPDGIDADIKVKCDQTETPPTKPIITGRQEYIRVICKNEPNEERNYVPKFGRYTESDPAVQKVNGVWTYTITILRDKHVEEFNKDFPGHEDTDPNAVTTMSWVWKDAEWKLVPVNGLRTVGAIIEVTCEPEAPTADELKKLEMAVQVKCVVDASQQHKDAYGLLGECDVDYFVGEPRKDGDDWLCDISYVPDLYVAEFNKAFPTPKHIQNDEKIVPVTLIWVGGSWQLKTQGRVHVTEVYTVTYTDGVDGEEVFADQVYSDLRKDSTTPAFNGTPTRTGYTFAGWEPEVAATVTQTVTYVAKWTPVKPEAPSADELKKLEMAVLVKCVVDDSQQHTEAYGLLGECDEDYFVGEPRKDGDDWLCDISYVPDLYVAEFNKAFPTPKHIQNDEKIVPVTLIWVGGSWQLKTQGRVHVTEVYTVTYTDGVDGEEVFADQVYSDLRKDSTTPAFNGTPTRTGYTFAGWEPEVAATVTQTVTYVAKWEKKTYKVVAKLYVNGKPAYYQNEDFYTYKVSGLYGENIDFDTIKAEAVEQAKQIKKASASYTAVILEDHEPNPVCTTYGEHQPGQATHYVKVNVKTEENVVIFQSFEGKTDLTKLHTTTAPYGTNVVEFLNGLGLDLDVAGYTLDTDEDGNTNWYKKDSPKWTFGANDTINGWTNVLLKYTITPHNIYAYLRTGDSIGDVLELNEATLNRLGLTKYNTEGFISIGTFVSNTLLTQDEYYGFDEDEAFLDVLAELQTKLVPETGVSLDKVGSKINWSWLYQPSDVDDRIAGYPTEDTDGYQLSGSLLLYGAKFEAGANDVTGMPTAAYGAYLDYFVSGESFNLPAAPTRPGYDFKGWKIGNAVLTAGAAYTVDEDDMVFTAQWEARTDTPYTVEHYLENLDGSYALDTTEPLKGTTDTTVTAAAKSYDNFTYDSTVPDTVASGNIAADGSLVLKLFYTRNTYDYTVRHIKQLPDGSYDEANAEVETLSGKFEALAAVTAKDYGSHYPTNDADTKQNIKIEKGLTIDVKYDLDEHTLTFETNGGSAVNPVTVRHGNAVARPADPTKDKYTFIGWYADPEFTEEYDFATVLEADKTIYAKFELTSTPIGDIYVRYDVLHIKQLPDGTYDLANAEVEHLSAKKDTTVTAVIKDYRATHHVNVNRTLSKLTGTAIQPYMGVDGKPVYTILSVYYDLDFHTLTFDTMGGSKIAPETVRHGLTVAKPKDPVNGGYWFDGWYTDKTYRTPYNFATPLTQDTTIYAKWFLIVLPGTTVKKTAPKLNTSDHFAYVQGYPDGTVKPAGNITRAETAAILFRLMDDASRKTYYSTKSGFRDVASGSWYNTYVATLNNAGVITDSSNGYFRPNEAITRAELAAMLAKFSETTGAANYFNDVAASHWAANAIAICAKLGWITGYPDGTFRPDKNVTRAELMAMINRATGRAPKSADAFLPGMKTWIDNTSDKWYYLDVQEATNSHSYTVKGSETWTALTSDPNWSLYE